MKYKDPGNVLKIKLLDGLAQIGKGIVSILAGQTMLIHTNIIVFEMLGWALVGIGFGYAWAVKTLHRNWLEEV